MSLPNKMSLRNNNKEQEKKEKELRYRGPLEPPQKSQK